MKTMFRHRARWVIALAAAGVVSGLTVASPALAFPGQGSCKEVAQTFSVPLAQSGELGEFASTLGKQGLTDDVSEELHKLCEPKP